MAHNNQYSHSLPHQRAYHPAHSLSPCYHTQMPPSSPNHYSPRSPPQQHQHTPQQHRYSPQEREQRRQERWEERSVSSEGSEYSEEYYTKRKPINKAKNAVMDNAEEIRKWIEARKRNYPRGETAAGKQRRLQKNQMSILEMKIRKKIVLVNADPRSLYKKLRNLDILRRFIVNPRPKAKKNSQVKSPDPRPSPKHEQIEGAEGQQMEQDLAQQKPIRKEQMQMKAGAVREQMKAGAVREQMKAETIIAHLLEKQKEDTEWMAKLMDYKSNSANYRYHCQTLETSLVLEDLFRESSYMLQVIRYVVANNFLQ